MADLRFTDLADAVESRAAGGGDVARLDAAISVSREVGNLADELLDHFIRQARSAGLSWGVIGERLGVSKQAARAKFLDRVARLRLVESEGMEVAPRLSACLDRAGEEARLDGSAQIGTHHLLLGLMEEGVAAAVLEGLKVRAEDIRATAASLFGSQGPEGKEIPPYSEQAAIALDGAQHMAHDNGADAVAPPHLLCLLVSDSGGKARRVLNEMGVSHTDIRREIDRYIIAPGRKRRRRRDQELICSFCRKPRSAVGPLVVGPNVHICAACVNVARDTFAEPAGAAN
ncbi:Clp protease N-terminal domain-containing protein [Actinomadura nitritigenes]|uniref:ClpX C4-type zinc finger protein n=1 Tax=Actinomadura nitritigenes TaxID=134602 RepID=UPI0036854D50